MGSINPALNPQEPCKSSSDLIRRSRAKPAESPELSIGAARLAISLTALVNLLLANDAFWFQNAPTRIRFVLLSGFGAMALRSSRNARRARRTQAEMFLDKLETLTKGDQSLIPNLRLREALDWDEETYKKIHTRLRQDQRINVGQGQGGKVGIARLASVSALKVFISYSHLDEPYKVDLIKHLDPLRRLKLIDSWHDGKITAGKNIDDAVAKELASADIIILLVSIDYLNSYYCIEIEMENAMERHAADKARVIPLILRSCMWQHMPFSSLKALPLDAKAISTWPDRDEALASVSHGIKIVADELMSSR